MLDNLIEWALRKKYPQETWSTLPTNKRVFLETALGGKKTPITEKDLTQEEIQYLQDKWKARVASALKTIEPYERGLRERIAADDVQAIKDKKLIPQARQEYERSLNAIELARKGVYNEDWQHLNKGNFGYFGNQMLQKLGYPDQHKAKGYLANPNVNYESYETPVDTARRENPSTIPDSTMQTTLGRYRYHINRLGKPVVIDTYDFNPVQGSGELEVGKPYEMVRSWAGRKLPPGQGRPVYINLDQ